MVTRFCKALGWLCTSCYLAGDCGQQETGLLQRKRARLIRRDRRPRGRELEAGPDSGLLSARIGGRERALGLSDYDQLRGRFVRNRGEVLLKSRREARLGIVDLFIKTHFPFRDRRKRPPQSAARPS